MGNRTRVAPHMVQTVSVRGMMLDVIVALIPALAMAVFLFGWWVLALCAISVASCVGFEQLYRLITRQKSVAHDLSACVTGLLLCLTLPPEAGWWAPVLGGFFAVVVVKQFYGGLGRNFMNPALGGRMLLASFPVLMRGWVDPALRLSILEVDALTAATPMTYLHAGNLPPQNLRELLLGYHGGSLGEVSAVLLLLGGFYLMGRRVISGRIPLSYLGTVALLTFLFPQGGCDRLEWMLAQMFSGGLILGAFFMATDPTTSPVTPRGHIMFGVGCGILTVMLRYFSSYPEGVGWAILTMNCCAWLLDKAGLPRRYGQTPFDGLRRAWANWRAYLVPVRLVRPRLETFFADDGTAPGEKYLDVLRQWAKNALWLGGTVAAMGALVFAVHVATDLDAVQAENLRRQELLDQVMPRAAYSSEAPYRVRGALSILAGYDEDNEHIGYCVEVQAQGFGGPVTMMVGVSLDGSVTGVAVTDHKETASVAEKAMEWGFLRQFVGRSGTVRLSGANRVDAVSGATDTSRAVVTGVNRALAIVAGLDEEHLVEFEDSETED